MMRTLQHILTILGLTFLISCTSSSFDFKGTRLVKIHLNINKFLIVNGSSIDTIDLTSYSGHNFINPYLDNQKEYLLLQETWKNEDLGSYNHQIVMLNLQGDIIDTIYIASENEDITSYSISPDNEKILIRSNDYFAWRQTFSLNPNESPLNVDTSKFVLDYNLVNIRDKEIVKRFSMKSNFYISDLTECSWSPDSKRILIYYRNLDKSKGDEKVVGLDLKTLDTAHVDYGKNAIWSPIKPNEIFYTKEKKLIKYNIDNKQSSVILSLKDSENFKDLRYTPDGNFLYFNYWKDRLCNRILGDIVCYPVNAYGKVYDLENMKSKRIKGHRNLETWKY